MKTIFKFLAIGLLFASCDDVEPTIYNGDYDQNDTFLSFSKSVYNLPIERDDVGQLTIVFNSSTKVDFDRTYDIEYSYPDEDAANPDTFTRPATITIEAGSYQGFVTIDGVDNNLVDEYVKTFRIEMVTPLQENEYMDSNITDVKVYEVCALQDDFLGDYDIRVNSSTFSSPAFETTTVTLREGDTPYDRVFDVKLLPDFTNDAQEVTIAFACDFVNLGGRYDAGIGCDDTIKMDPVDLAFRAAYDTTDDSSFEVNFVENATADCGATPVIVTLSFTKVE